jgi:hypothetical protein
MRALLAVCLWFATSVYAQGIVLDPGPGTKYLAQWCGGQFVNEYAEGFTDAGPATTVRVWTSCHGSGRGSKNHYYVACWHVVFDWNGVQLSAQFLNAGSWLQGNPPVACQADINPAAEFYHLDADGNADASLYTVQLPNTGVYRAVLEYPIP